MLIIEETAFAEITVKEPTNIQMLLRHCKFVHAASMSILRENRLGPKSNVELVNCSTTFALH